MRHEYENARRHAANTLAEVNRHLDRGNIRNPQHHQMLTNMAKEATETLRNLDEMDDARLYGNTNIGYGANARERRVHSDTRRMIEDAMDAIGKVLPHISDDYDDDMDDDAEARRGRPRRTRRGVGRWTQVRTHTRRMPRGEMDDMDDMDLDDDMESRRRRGKSGRFIRGDIDDMRYEIDDARRAADEARRTADDARRTADDARRAADDVRSIYPGHPPVMPHNDRQAPHSDDRYTTRSDDRSDRTGPDMRR